MLELLWVVIGLNILLIVLLILLIIKSFNNKGNSDIFKTFSSMIKDNNEMYANNQINRLDNLSRNINESVNNLKEIVSQTNSNNENRFEFIKQNLNEEIQKIRIETKSKLDEIDNTLKIELTSLQKQVDGSLATSRNENELKLENIRSTLYSSISELQKSNESKLEKMQGIVDEKLESTLNKRITESFKAVNDQLIQVYEGIGEVKSVAKDVGDLKNVLSNVKTKGILGEVQLGSILAQLLSKEQYEMNIITKEGSSDRVEFAVKLPGQKSNNNVYLPIDSKFPLQLYYNLIEAYEIGSKVSIDQTKKDLASRIKSEAKKINEKYIDVPNTTEFAIMFLPLEGLYSEVINSGVTEELQRDYKIVIAGPTTMAALLNSLQMGFKTLAIQKKSGEVWKILGSVKKEFKKFEDVLTSAQKKINEANSDIDKLVGARTRQINRKLSNITLGESIEEEMLLDNEEED